MSGTEASIAAAECRNNRLNALDAVRHSRTDRSVEAPARISVSGLLIGDVKHECSRNL